MPRFLVETLRGYLANPEDCKAAVIGSMLRIEAICFSEVVYEEGFAILQGLDGVRRFIIEDLAYGLDDPPQLDNCQNDLIVCVKGRLNPGYLILRPFDKDHNVSADTKIWQSCWRRQGGNKGFRIRGTEP
jgi:hypothetical protein